MAAVLLGTRSRRGWWAWGVQPGAGRQFSRLVQACHRNPSGGRIGRDDPLWGETFPPRDSFVSLLAWLARVHAGPLLAVPIGGDHWGSIGTTLICLVAVGVLFHKGRYRLLVLCAAPFALNLIAAAMRRFPYGGHMRLAMHVVPLVCILAGIGVTAVSSGSSRRPIDSPQPCETAPATMVPATNS